MNNVILIPVEYRYCLSSIDSKSFLFNDIRSNETIKEILDSCVSNFDETCSLKINGEYVLKDNFSDYIIKYYDGKNNVKMEVIFHADDFENEGKAWLEYLKYVKKWSIAHKHLDDMGKSPECFDVWLAHRCGNFNCRIADSRIDEDELAQIIASNFCDYIGKQGFQDILDNIKQDLESRFDNEGV